MDLNRSITMSWWTNLRDIGEGIATGGASLGFNESAANSAGGLINKITGRPSSEEKRNQLNAVNDQIKAYKDQTDLARKQTEDIQAQQKIERSKINEKQIRALRNTYRPSAGFLNNQAAGSPAPNNLGASPGVTNKLGTA